MNTQMIMGIVRHLLTAAGGASVAVSDNELQTIVSAIVTVVSIGWSIYEKHSAKPKE